MDVPEVIAGRYRVMRELGRGGMGAVYLVEHVHTGEQLALKLLLAHVGAQKDVVERFKREARAPAKIRSEHVVRVTDADVAPELGGAPFMVMEALEGKDLEATVAERGPLPPSEVVWILGQVASALDKAHALGIVHRDLKPENLFIHRRDDGSSIVKILDFGISKMQGAPEAGDMATAGLTKTGAMMGTPLYMSPEQARGLSAQVGPATDMWAIGLIALHLLSADVYWQANTIADLMVQILAAPLVPPSQRFPAVGNRIDAWFARSCERDPSRRWASVNEQVQALAMALGVTAPPPPSLDLNRMRASGASSTPISATPPPSGNAVAAKSAPPGGASGMGQSTASGSALSRSTTQASPTNANNGAKIFVAVIGVVMAVGALGGLFVVLQKKPSSPSAGGLVSPPSAASVAPNVIALPPPATVTVPQETPPAPSAAASVAPVAPVAPKTAPNGSKPAAPETPKPRPAEPPPSKTSPKPPAPNPSARFNPEAP